MQNEDMAQNKKKRRSVIKKIAIAILWVAAIAVVAFLVLFIASKVGQFNSIGDMLDYIWAQF